MATQSVLIVDDEPDIRELLDITLSRMGLRTFSAATLEEAQTKVVELQPDLCLTDMRLPDGNGISLVEYIQQEFLQPIKYGWRKKPVMVRDIVTVGAFLGQVGCRKGEQLGQSRGVGGSVTGQQRSAYLLRALVNLFDTFHRRHLCQHNSRRAFLASSQ